MAEVAASSGNGIMINAGRGLQIVNGGQTTASLHRSRKQDKANLDGILVPAKIIKVKAANLDAMVTAVSRSANSQNTIQPADFSANDPFHVSVEALANNVWLPDQKGRWFYERARGSYGAAEAKASGKASDKRRFASETPKERRFSKTDLAKYLHAWDGFPHLVSFGNQKNFQSFMQRLKEQFSDGIVPDERWYRAFIAKAITFRSVQAVAKAKKFPAYQANVAAYTVACLSWKSAGQVDFERIWSHQSLSREMLSILQNWVVDIERYLRESAKSRMVSEWAKKLECCEAIREAPLKFPSPLPPELRVQGATSSESEMILANSQAKSRAAVSI